MLNAQKISGLYRKASHQSSHNTEHLLDKYESNAAESTEKKSAKHFKTILQKEISKKDDKAHS